MGQISVKLRSWASGDRGGVTFWCPGCREYHTISTRGGAVWHWDGNKDAPTFSPSVLVTSGHFAPGQKPSDQCWCTWNKENPADPAPFVCYRCHSFVRAGVIQFLSDSTHALAGQTVPLPDLPDQEGSSR